MNVTRQIRGTLSNANPEPSLRNQEGVETRRRASKEKSMMKG
jgi:hypothetical protein